MHLAGYLRLKLKRLYYLLKSTGIAFWIPIVLVDVVIPLFSRSAVEKYGVKDEAYFMIVQLMLLLVPFMSSWWLMIALREFVESDGCEIMYINRDKNKFLDCVSIFLFYLLNVLAVSLYIRRWFPQIMTEFQKEALICLFYLGLTHFLTFITRSTTVTMMATILYTLTCVIFGMVGNGKVILPFYYYFDTATRFFDKIYFPLAAIGIGLLFSSCVINRRTSKV